MTVLVPVLVWIVVGAAVITPVLTIWDSQRAAQRLEVGHPVAYEVSWPGNSANRSFWWSTGWTGTRATAIGFQFVATISLGSGRTLSFCCA
jgi:hypothetical protein